MVSGLDLARATRRVRFTARKKGTRMSKTKFKKRWIKSVRYCFSYFEHTYILFSFQISKTYLCDTYKPITQSENC